MSRLGSGDNGITKDVRGVCVSKKDKKNVFIGTVDELSSYLGTINNIVYHKDSKVTIMSVQVTLMQIMSGFEPTPEDLEHDIYLMESELQRLSHFIIPQHPLHYARTICRRTERKCIGIQDISYLNRLSYYLFIHARFQSPDYEVKYDIKRDKLYVSLCELNSTLK